jgi:hypothetical protein
VIVRRMLHGFQAAAQRPCDRDQRDVSNQGEMHGSPTSDWLTHLTIAPRFASSILHGEGGGERGIKGDEIQTETQAISYLLRSSIEDERHLRE